MIYITIAARNILKNKKHSIVFGCSLFFTCLFFLFGNALGNGSGKMLADRFRNFQSGDVVVSWKNVKDIPDDDPGRLLFSEINIETDAKNKAAIDSVEQFCAVNREKIRGVYRPVRGFGTLDSGTYATYSVLYGLSEKELLHLFNTKILSLHEGVPLFDYEYAAYISKATAEENNLDIGDWFTFDCPTVYGPVNSIRFQVAGIYKNGAPWDNAFIYTSKQYAQQALAVDPGYSSSFRIFLADPDSDISVAAELDALLLAKSDVLRAESRSETIGFWATFGDFQKNIYLFFSFFLLFIIGLGMRAGVRVSVFNRMKTYGTLQAIGYTKGQTLLIIILETLLLSLISLAAAIAASTILTIVFGYFGFYVGGFGFEYITGGEYLYPEFNLTDLLMMVFLLSIFSVFAPLKPGLRIITQSIPRLLAENYASGSFIINQIRKKLTARRDRLSAIQSAGIQYITQTDYRDKR